MRILGLCFALGLIGCSNSDAISPDSTSDGGTKGDGGARDDSGSGDGGSSEGGTTGPGETVSGSRLRARYLTGDDGSKSFVGWYDSARSEDCNFVTASDGTQRCEPTIGAGTLGPTFFAAGCSQPIGYAASSCAAPHYLTQSTLAASCGYTTSIYTVTSSTSVAYTGTPAACSLWTIAGYTFYNYDATEIPSSSFVQGTESHE